MMTVKKLFGTDGIRAKAGVFPLDAKTVTNIGSVLIRILSQKYPNQPATILIGRDTRSSGTQIEKALVDGILHQGGSVQLAGIVPTPAVASLTRAHPVLAGVMISASHNFYEDNGIKIFGHDGFKLPDEWEREIETQVAHFKSGGTNVCNLSKNTTLKEGPEEFMAYLKETISGPRDFRGMKVVVDCAQGAASFIAPLLFQSLGANTTVLHNEPNGRNINEKCGALFPELLCQRVRSQNADLGIAVDGDADRLILVDESGKICDGDDVLAMCGVDLHREKKLKHQTVVATDMSNYGLEKLFKEQGIALVRTAVGDKYIVSQMRKEGYNLGGEQCGHIIFLDDSTTGDGLLSALKVLSMMKKNNQPLSKLTSILEKVPQLLVNISVSQKIPFEELPKTLDKKEEIEKNLQGQGRVLLRYSGTENLARVMVEGQDPMEIQKWANALAHTLKTELSQWQP